MKEVVEMHPVRKFVTSNIPFGLKFAWRLLAVLILTFSSPLILIGLWLDKSTVDPLGEIKKIVKWGWCELLWDRDL